MAERARNARQDVEVGFRTHVGMVRSENQDHYGYIDPESETELFAKGRLLVVCDGMGGHNGGTVASRTTVDAVLASFRAFSGDSLKLLLGQAIAEANAFVRDKGSKDPTLRNMGTTCVAAVIRGKTCQVAHIGDSRAYVIQSGEIRQVTRDHTYLNDLIDIGLLTPEKARNHPERNIITRCVGMGEALQVDFTRIDLNAGDGVVLCSDGLFNHVENHEILDLFSREEPQVAAQALVDLANQRGGEDNITVALLRVSSIAQGFLDADLKRSAEPESFGDPDPAGVTPVMEIRNEESTPIAPFPRPAHVPRGDTTLQAMPEFGSKQPWSKGWLVLIAIELLILVILLWQLRN
jgi:serine/threonine protein phosphatase PrpC